MVLGEKLTTSQPKKLLTFYQKPSTGHTQDYPQQKRQKLPKD
jgi:hypothetical protein